MPIATTALAKLGGNLQKVWDLVRAGPQTADLARVGQPFLDAAAANPNYFRTSRELPFGMDDREKIRFLNAKHGTDFDIMKTPGGFVANDMGLGANMAANKFGVESNVFASQGHPGTRTLIDTMGAEAGTGAARKAYPPMWEFIMSHPDLYNTGFGLTDNNTIRRSTNMAPGAEKYGKLFTNNILLDPEQLPTADDFSNIAQHLRPDLDPIADRHRICVRGDLIGA